MNLQLGVSALTVVSAALVAVFSSLPYPWAHLVSAGLGGAIAGMHGTSLTISSLSKPTTDGKSETS